MLVSTTSLPPGHSETWPLNHSLSLRAVPGAIPHARHWNFAGQFIDDVEIATSELITNAVQACQRDRTTRLCRVRPITLDIRSNFGAVVIEVADPLTDAPQIRADDDARISGGWGLVFVEVFAESWGYYRTDDGKIVWASFTRY
jgi:anti-sigma regulatory factor (Ser/Thr protein kinase)